MVSVETGIAPQLILDAPEGMLDAMLDWMKRKADDNRKRGM